MRSGPGQGKDEAREASRRRIGDVATFPFDSHAAMWHNGGVGTIKRRDRRMSLQMHLSELERKHQALEREIQDAMSHPSSDDLRIAELKRRKLQLKDEIAKLRTVNQRVVH
jgi:hypothetical protein